MSLTYIAKVDDGDVFYQYNERHDADRWEMTYVRGETPDALDPPSCFTVAPESIVQLFYKCRNIRHTTEFQTQNEQRRERFRKAHRRVLRETNHQMPDMGEDLIMRHMTEPVQGLLAQFKDSDLPSRLKKMMRGHVIFHPRKQQRRLPRLPGVTS